MYSPLYIFNPITLNYLIRKRGAKVGLFFKIAKHFI